MKPIFKDDAARTKMLDWYERCRSKLSVATESRTVATQFGDTHVLVGGPATAPPLVMVHGAMASSAHMAVELEPMFASHHVYCIDVIGQSPKTPHQRPSVKNNEYGIWLAEVLDGLSLSRVPLVAVSWGGFAAIRLAAHAPERIEKLALLVPAGLVNGHAWQGITKMMWPMMMWRMFPSDARFAKFAQSLLTTLDDDWLPYLHDAFRSFNMDMRVPKLATPEELARLTAPVLVIAGDQDYSFPGDKAIARAKQLFPTLTATELVENCKHCPPTTPQFRQWLSSRIQSFVRQPDNAAAAAS